MRCECWRANGSPSSFTLRVAIVEETIVTAAKAGERDVQTVPMAVSAVSSAEIARLGTQTIERRARARSVGHVFPEHRFGSAHDPRDRGEHVCSPGRIRVRRCISTACTSLDRRWRSRSSSIWIASKCCAGPQGTLYGRNAVGGAINLITRPPTNDFQASAGFTAGNFGELRADARISGPLKRDRVMGAVAFARGVRDGYVRDLEHPDHPLGGDDVTAARGQLRVVFDRRTSLLLSSDVDRQSGTPLTYNKVLVGEAGISTSTTRPIFTTFDRPRSPGIARCSPARARV